jgi:MinD-like ATPase involved in chromosome partitioning or flagellar assembly
MDGRRAPQGLDAEDRIAFGLTAPRLFYLLLFSMAGWGFLSSQMPWLLRTPPGVLLLAAGAALAWGRIAGRPLDRWAVLYGAYMLRPRRSAAPAVRALEVAVVAAPGLTILPPVAEAASGTAHAPEAHNVLQLPRTEHTRGGRAKRVVFFSLRGGSGKSTFAAELAAGLAAGAWDDGATISQWRLALLDLDLRSSTMCIATGLNGPTLGDVVSAPVIDSAAIETSMLRHESGARVMLAPPRASADGGFLPAVARVLAYLDEQGFDFVIFDVAGGIDDLNSYVLQLADEIYYVFRGDAAGVYDLYRGIETLRRLGHREKIRYVANLCDGADMSEVMGDLRGTLTASLPTSAAVARAADLHRSAVLDDRPTAGLLRPLALSILGERADSHLLMAASASWSQPAAARR